jgi:hypothetical protein
VERTLWSSSSPEYKPEHKGSTVAKRFRRHQKMELDAQQCKNLRIGLQHEIKKISQNF